MGTSDHRRRIKRPQGSSAVPTRGFTSFTAQAAAQGRNIRIIRPYSMARATTSSIFSFTMNVSPLISTIVVSGRSSIVRINSALTTNRVLLSRVRLIKVVRPSHFSIRPPPNSAYGPHRAQRASCPYLSGYHEQFIEEIIGGRDHSTGRTKTGRRGDKSDKFACQIHIAQFERAGDDPAGPQRLRC